MAWTSCKDHLPPNGVEVDTKIDDCHGCRNEAILYRTANLWFLKDGMCIYYDPTHWKYQLDSPIKD